jgi:hypothetical protein
MDWRALISTNITSMLEAKSFEMVAFFLSRSGTRPPFQMKLNVPISPLGIKEHLWDLGASLAA